MSTPVIAFFNNKGGVGKTSLVYHLAWMYADIGVRVVAADLDPQANLTSAFLDDDRLEALWPEGEHAETVFGCVQPLLRGTGDITHPHLEDVMVQGSLFYGNPIALLVGDLLLSTFEDDLSDVWPRCLDGNERAFRVVSAFWRMMQQAATTHRADIILMDLGPNLGAINRSALNLSNQLIEISNNWQRRLLHARRLHYPGFIRCMRVRCSRRSYEVENFCTFSWIGEPKKVDWARLRDVSSWIANVVSSPAWSCVCGSTVPVMCQTLPCCCMPVTRTTRVSRAMLVLASGGPAKTFFVIDPALLLRFSCPLMT